MKIICVECHRELGEKFPFDDPSATHTICLECIEKRLIETGKEILKRKLIETFNKKRCVSTTADGGPKTAEGRPLRDDG